VDYSLRTYANLGSHIDFRSGCGSRERWTNCDSSIFTAMIDTEDPNLVVVADSVARLVVRGAQGERNWFYGHYNKTADPVPGYQRRIYPVPAQRWSAERGKFLGRGTLWDWFNGNPPWDEIGSVRPAFRRPNSTGANHWVIRRWSARSAEHHRGLDAGQAKQSLAAMRDRRIFRNGVQRPIPP